MFDLLLVALVQAVAGEPAPAAEGAPTAESQPAPAGETAQVADSDQVVCRREPIIGTRLSRRVCMTAAQERQMQEDSRAALNRAQSQGTVRSN